MDALRLSTLHLVALLAMLLFSASLSAAEQTGDGVSGKVPNPGTELWRQVRAGPPAGIGSSQVGSTGADTLIAESGEKWRIARQEWLVPYGGWFMAAILVVILIFHFSRIPPERFDSSGGTITRFEEFDRIMHWAMAGLFIFLGLSGLILLLGRFLILPVVGQQAFGAIASACKEGHNLFGPIFLVILAVFLFRFVGRNGYERGDIDWVKKGGGMLGGEHPEAGFFNAGEKMLYWSVFFGGLILCVTGVILVFPQFGQPRELMQDMLLIHGIVAVGLIAFTFGHMYLATVGVPGSLGGMNSGEVDADWAKTHHYRWFKECVNDDLIKKPPESN